MENQQINKQCPYCKSEIDISATKCPQCQSDLRSWPIRHLFLLLMGTIIVITIMAVWQSFSNRIEDKGGSNSIGLTSSLASPKIYVLTEKECGIVVDEITAVIDNKSTAKSELPKNIFERYLRDTGVAVKNPTDNLPRYILPQSDCGKALDGLLKIMISGMR